MILVLVVWLLVGWVRSQQDAVASHDRERRAHLKRRMLERLAKRGLEMEERQNVARDLLARVNDHLTTIRSAASPPSGSQRQNHHSLYRDSNMSHNVRQVASQLIEERPTYPEILAYAEAYPELRLSADYSRHEVITEEEEEETRKRVLNEYLAEEDLPEQMRDQREAASYSPSRQKKIDRQRRREEQRRENRRKRGQKKRKRTENKRRLKQIDPEIQSLVDHTELNFHEEGDEKYIDCCPSKLVTVKKAVGKGRNYRALQIKPSHQYFHERVCLEEYKDKECLFPSKALRKGTITRCVQQYSYSQALARMYNTSEEWKLDFIETMSGCSCQVSVTHKKKKRKRKR